jgi:hypothetical protein
MQGVAQRDPPKALDSSRLERDLKDAFKATEEPDRTALVTIMELMASMERPSRLYVTSYPACNSEA